ncbi:hypothetical protein [Bacillus amyloliquefaciens]|uniref:hypothetical protein n=1 Tax=Bacillus TaxID=1386 RepID=UPI001ABECDE9|nr:hypothetical protein [Bacillus amyloliquefaciens]QTG87369.1 hypothetical protein J4048_20820 [Bacillus amyloliquefaciens]
MDLVIGRFYAGDHVNEDGVIETNVMRILAKRDGLMGEVSSEFYVTETMQLVDGQFESIYKNDWLPKYLKRVATDSEVEMFKYHRGLNGGLKTWAEIIQE